jgi:hypothetical protein
MPSPLTLDGAGTWPAILRNKTGATEVLAHGNTETSTVGSYRFTAP